MRAAGIAHGGAGRRRQAEPDRAHQAALHQHVGALERAAFAGGLPAAVLFASGSAVRGLLRLADPDLLDDCRRVPAICIGPRTSAVALDNGFRILGGSDTDDRTAEALAATTARLLAPVGVTT